MAENNKVKKLSAVIGVDAMDFISDLYLKENKCPLEISDFIFQKTGVKISPRSIQRNVKRLGINRNRSAAFNLAIKIGRKNYNKLRKPVKSRELRKGISLKLRYEIFKRDGFKCVLCGATAQDDLLMIDHIKPVVKGGLNECENLRTLCRQCNLGKMISEHEK